MNRPSQALAVSLAALVGLAAGAGGGDGSSTLPMLVDVSGHPTFRRRGNDNKNRVRRIKRECTRRGKVYRSGR